MFDVSVERQGAHTIMTVRGDIDDFRCTDIGFIDILLFDPLVMIDRLDVPTEHREIENISMSIYGDSDSIVVSCEFDELDDR